MEKLTDCHQRCSFTVYSICLHKSAEHNQHNLIWRLKCWGWTKHQKVWFDFCQQQKRVKLKGNWKLCQILQVHSYNENPASLLVNVCVCLCHHQGHLTLSSCQRQVTDLSDSKVSISRRRTDRWSAVTCLAFSCCSDAESTNQTPRTGWCVKMSYCRADRRWQKGESETVFQLCVCGWCTQKTSGNSRK